MMDEVVEINKEIQKANEELWRIMHR